MNGWAGIKKIFGQRTEKEVKKKRNKKRDSQSKRAATKKRKSIRAMPSVSLRPGMTVTVWMMTIVITERTISCRLRLFCCVLLRIPPHPSLSHPLSLRTLSCLSLEIRPDASVSRLSHPVTVPVFRKTISTASLDDGKFRRRNPASPSLKPLNVLRTKQGSLLGGFTEHSIFLAAAPLL